MHGKTMDQQHLLTILIAVCAVTYSFEIVFGMAGTIMMLAVMGLLVSDTKALVIFSLLPQMLVAVIALSKSYRRMEPKLVLQMLALAAVGGLLGGYVFVHLPQQVFGRTLAAVIMLAGLLLILSPRFSIGRTSGRALDFLSGLSHTLFGISGPVVMTRLLGTLEDKTVIRNSALLFFTGLNCVRAVYYLASRMITPQMQHMYMVSAVFLVPVLFLADRLHFKLDDVLFRRVVSWIIFFSGIAYLLR